MQEIGIECSHEPCVCNVSASIESGEGYCGDFCREAAEDGTETDTCGCGHPPCDEP